MGKRYEQTLHKRQYTDGKEAKKIHSTSLITGRMQTNHSQMHCTFIEWLKSKTLPVTSASKDVEQLKLSHIVGIQNRTPTVHNCWPSFCKVKCALVMWLSNPILGYLYERNKDLCSRRTWIFMITLVIIAPNWKSLKCPSIVTG